MRTRLVDLVQKGVDDGRVRACDPAQVVDLVLAIADGSMMQRVTMDSDSEALIDALAKHVIAPLRAAKEKAA